MAGRRTGRPLERWRQASRMANRPIGTMSPVSSASAMNSGTGRNAHPVTPAEQRFGADHAAVAQVDDRLVVNASSSWRPPLQRGLQLEPASRGACIRPRRARTAPCRAAWPRTSRGRRCAAAPRGRVACRARCRCWRASGPACPGCEGPVEGVEHAPRPACGASVAAFSSRTANSSPPNRAGVSAGRRVPPRRSPTATSSSSPAPWPRLSLIVLKSSRSRKSTASEKSRSPLARSSACWTRSVKSARLASPVSESCSAWWRSCASSSFRVVMSSIKALKRTTPPPCAAQIVSSMGNWWPSRWTASSSMRRERMRPSPVVAYRRRPSRWAARWPIGTMSSASSTPIASVRGHPKVRSAWWFQSSTIPSLSMATKA